MTTNDLASVAAAGLREDEAQRRLQRDGPNDIEPARRRSLARRALGLLTEPMFALLLAAVLIYLALGDLGEGLTLAVFVLAVLALTLVQEGRADRSIEALRRLSEHRVELIRGGVVVERAARIRRDPQLEPLPVCLDDVAVVRTCEFCKKDLLKALRRSQRRRACGSWGARPLGA
jgi:magnesium-transporting ATPase (P-type)